MEPPQRKMSLLVEETPETPPNPFKLDNMSEHSYRLVSCTSSESEVPHVLLKKEVEVFSDHSADSD